MSLTTQDRILIETRITNAAPSVVLAYALWFFLGFVGAHRFYLGRPGTAILQVLSLFVLVGFLWLLLDAFLIPAMVRAKQDELRRRFTAEAQGQSLAIGNP